MDDDLVKRLNYWHQSGLHPDCYKAALSDFKIAADRIEKLEAEVKSVAMDCLVAHGQASDAYEAQLLAEAKLNDQTQLIEQLFALLDIKEQKDDGRYFHPNIIRSSRALDAEKLETIMAELKRTVTANSKSNG